MSFHNLLHSDVARIFLANLHSTFRDRVLPAPVFNNALLRLSDELAKLADPTNQRSVNGAIKKALLSTPTRFQVQSRVAPKGDFEICAVVSFDKVRTILERIGQRTRKHLSLIDGIIAEDAKPRMVAKAAPLINQYAPLSPDFNLSNWPTIFWATPTSEIVRLKQEWNSSPRKATHSFARHLRDSLGLVHIDIDDDDTARHLFLFRGKVPLETIGQTKNLIVQYARPSTLDGWDNRRFCQSFPFGSRMPNCGCTIDLADGTFGLGAAELVVTPVPMMHFECEYVGEINGSDHSCDASFLRVLAPLNSAIDMADALDQKVVSTLHRKTSAAKRTAPVGERKT